MKKKRKTENGKKDYECYIFTWKEVLKLLVQCTVTCIVFDYLFYESLWALPVLIFFCVIYFKWKNKQCIRERKKRLNYQFRDALTSLSVAVQAGYSVENAVSACVHDLSRLYVQGSDILEEFRYMENQIKLSVPVEELFMDLGKRSGVEDIENFASVFFTAKRTGGDMNRVIQQVARMLGDKIDVKKEIEATLAAKKSEQMVMSLMPVGIIFYLKLTSPGFLDMLYGNFLGVAVMSVCLGIYGVAYWLGMKIVDIEV